MSQSQKLAAFSSSRLRNRGLQVLALTGLFAVFAGSAQAADVVAGKKYFDQACAMCHSAVPGDGAGGMGPDLHSMSGKRAGAVDKDYPTTAALRGTKLVWNVANLDRFLAAPTKVAPGTEMVVAVPSAMVRANVVAYLLAAKKAPARK